jgi:hypothetical protein
MPKVKAEEVKPMDKEKVKKVEKSKTVVAPQIYNCDDYDDTEFIAILKRNDNGDLKHSEIVAILDPQSYAPSISTFMSTVYCMVRMNRDVMLVDVQSALDTNAANRGINNDRVIIKKNVLDGLLGSYDLTSTNSIPVLDGRSLTVGDLQTKKL